MVGSPKMSIEDENTEPVTDLGLALGYSNQYIQRRLNSEDSSAGAGANAGLELDMTFVANNPLSELVWSAHKGLSLKCIYSSFADTRTSLFWGAGPSNVALLPTTHVSGRMSATSKRLVEENFLTPNSTFDMNREAPGKAEDIVMPVCGLDHEKETGTGDEVKEMNTAAGVSILDINRREASEDSKGDEFSGSIKSKIAETQTREKHFSALPDDYCSPGPINREQSHNLSIKSDQPEPDVAQTELLSGDPHGGERDDDSTKNGMLMDLNECGTSGAPLLDKMLHGRKCFEKMESTAENDLRNLKSEYVFGAADEIVALDLNPTVKESSQQDEETPTNRNKTVMVEHSPTNSRIQMYRRKGKEKALSDGDLSGRISKDYDDSHESVESCNTDRLFAMGKRRQSFEEDMVVGSKSCQSVAYAGQDSSFVNWISNMMKGFLKSSQDEAPFALGQPDCVHANPEQSNKNQDPGPKNIGFQSMFRSLYCTKPGVHETRGNVDCQTGEVCRKVESSTKMCNINATPITCQGETSNIGRQFLMLSDRYNESPSGNQTDSVAQPKILSEIFSGSQEKGITNSEENKIVCNLAFSREKEVTSSNSSLGKRKTNSAENVNSDLPSSGRTTSKFCHRNDPLGSLWITRFAPKNPGPSLNPELLIHSSSGAAKSPTECLKINPYSQHLGGLSIDNTIVETRDNSMDDLQVFNGKEVQNPVADSEAYSLFNKVGSHNDENSMCKLNPILPSSKFRNSEAMASVFAKRLGALKHIIPPGVTGDAAHTTVTCFFCGKKGHDLQDCCEITEIELEELLRNLDTTGGAEKLPCLCIRCFQLDHWAAACPKATSAPQIQLEANASLNDQHRLSEMQLNSGNEENAKLQIGKDTQFLSAAANSSRDEDDERVGTDLNLKADEMIARKKRRSLSLVNKNITSSSGESMMKENQILPLSNIVHSQSSNVPEGLFDVVKRLRLSRTDIMKWMNSNMPLSHLDGFFLRLRLGKWEEGLGGTGYYVASIIETRREHKMEDTKASILVNVGGMKCLVKAQYVSNQDFLEDELQAWWSTTAKNGGDIPSEEELRIKVKTKRILGF